MFYILLLLLCLTPILFPFLRRGVLRFLMMQKIKKFCAIRKFRLEKGRDKKNNEADFYVDTGIHLYAVRVYSALYANSSVVFSEEHTVTVRRKTSQVYYRDSNKKTVTHEGGHRAFEPLRVSRAKCKDRNVFPILLMHPTCRSIYCQRKSGVEICKNGDVICGMKLFNEQAFLKILQASV